MKKQKVAFSEFMCGICFALFFFAFMLTEAFINERCAAILGSDAVNTVYALGLICTGLGFLSFAMFRKIFKTEKARKAVLLSVGVLCLAVAVVLLMADRPVIFVIGAIASLLLIGHMGGCVYYNTAMYFAESRHMGRMIGISMGTAIFLQFVVQNLTPESVSFAVSIYLSVAFVMYFIIWMPKDWILENPLPYSSDGRRDYKTAVAMIVAVVLMSLVVGMIDSVLTSFNAQKAYDVYSGVRLFYAVGLILAGFIADIGKRKYLPVATVCTILLSTVCMFFLSEEISYFAGTALMYLYSGFYVMFFTVMFLDFAPKSKCPELWAGMGRIVRSFTVAVTILPAFKIYDIAGNIALAVISCLVSICILLVLLPYIGRAVTDSEQSESVSGQMEMSPQERLKLYAQHCALTPRETEVLEMLLTTEKDLQEIADKLYISRRMVQRYVSSIYEKTETKTRIGLFKSYMDFTSD